MTNTDITSGDLEYAGRRAYTAYGEAVGWTAVSGSPMPQWDNIGEKVQGAWTKAAGVVLAFGEMVRSGQLLDGNDDDELHAEGCDWCAWEAIIRAIPRKLLADALKTAAAS